MKTHQISSVADEAEAPSARQMDPLDEPADENRRDPRQRDHGQLRKPQDHRAPEQRPDADIERQRSDRRSRSRGRAGRHRRHVPRRHQPRHFRGFGPVGHARRPDQRVAADHAARDQFAQPLVRKRTFLLAVTTRVPLPVSHVLPLEKYSPLALPVTPARPPPLACQAAASSRRDVIIARRSIRW
jgi:hypothetical protein